MPSPAYWKPQPYDDGSDLYRPPDWDLDQGRRDVMDTLTPLPGATFNSIPNYINDVPYGKIAGIGMSLAGIAGAWGQANRPIRKGDFDYDPSRKALKFAEQIGNQNSDLWRTIWSHYVKVGTGMAGSVDTETGVARVGGADDRTATGLGQMRNKVQQRRNLGQLSDMMEKQFIDSQGLALNALGLEADRAKYQNQMYNQALDEQAKSKGSFFDNIVGTGMSIASLFA